MLASNDLQAPTQSGRLLDGYKKMQRLEMSGWRRRQQPSNRCEEVKGYDFNTVLARQSSRFWKYSQYNGNR